MRYVRHKNQLLIMILAVGFFIGIIYENMAVNRGMEMVNIAVREIQGKKTDYLFYILKNRLIPFGVLGLLWNFRWRRELLFVVLAWSGMVLGRTVVSLLITYGGKGVLLCAALVIPHYVFYILSYGVVIVYLCGNKRVQWNRVKTIAMLTMFFTGIILEVYVNPVVLNFILKCL